MCGVITDVQKVFENAIFLNADALAGTVGAEYREAGKAAAAFVADFSKRL